MSYRISRWQRDGDTWIPVKSGLTKERAEALVEAARWDPRTALRRYRVEAEG